MKLDEKKMQDVLMTDNTWTNQHVDGINESGTLYTIMPQNTNINFTNDAALPLGVDVNKLLSDKNDEYSRSQLPLFIVLGFLMFAGVIGNSLVINVYWHSVRNSSKKTFIMALALLDLSVCAIVIPFEIYDLRNQFKFYSEGLCKAMRMLEYSTVVAAGLVLVSVSFERYYFLCKAFQSFTPKKSKLVCLICTLIAILVASPSAVFAGLKTRTETVGNVVINGSECSMDSESVKSSLKRVYFYVLALICVVCILLLVAIYTIIARLLYKYNRGELAPSISLLPVSTKDKCSKDENSDSSLTKHVVTTVDGKKRRSRNNGSIIIFFSVALVFVLSFTPHLVIRIIISINPDLVEKNLLYNLVVRSYLISNVANPFIYSILNASFRQQLEKTLRKMTDCFTKNRNGTLV